MILPPTILPFTFRRRRAATRLVRAHVSQSARPPFTSFACVAVPTLRLLHAILPNEPKLPSRPRPSPWRSNLCREVAQETQGQEFVFFAVPILRFANAILPNEPKPNHNMRIFRNLQKKNRCPDAEDFGFPAPPAAAVQAQLRRFKVDQAKFSAPSQPAQIFRAIPNRRVATGAEIRCRPPLHCCVQTCPHTGTISRTTQTSVLPSDSLLRPESMRGAARPSLGWEGKFFPFLFIDS
jgi:hypothetical protein